MAVRLKHKCALVAVCAAITLLAAPAWASEILVYAQNPDGQNLYASQNDTSVGGFGAFATSYDNFTLGPNTSINQVEWTGGYYNPQSPGTITAWTVTFWSDSAGQPGSALATFSISGNGSETSLGNDLLGDPIFLYTAAVSFNATGGTQYWLSVVPDTAFPPQWGWQTSSQGDGQSYQDLFGNRSQNLTDLSFALYEQQQSTVPEPGSLMLMGSGILGMAGLLRRKFRA